MGTDFYNLYKLIDARKDSIIDNLYQIDKCISSAMENTSPRIKLNRHCFLLETVKVLEDFVKISFLAESRLEHITHSLQQLEEGETYPDVERRASNPFFMPALPPQEFLERVSIMSQSSADLQLKDKVTSEEVTVNGDGDSGGAAPPQIESDLSPKQPATALAKLQAMKVPDRLKEAQSKYDKKVLPDNFTFNVQPMKSMSPFLEGVAEDGDTKKKDTGGALYGIENDTLVVKQICTFCHVVSPGEFYVRTNEMFFRDLERSLNEDLNLLYFSVVANYKNKNDARVLLGDYCFAFLTKRSAWFRVQVINWMMTDSDKVLVHLVDHGENFVVYYKNLRRMTDIFSKFPKMAIRCHFAHLFSPFKTENWPRDSIEALKDLVGKMSTKKFEVIYAVMEGNSCGVDFVEEGSSEQTTLAEILLSRKLAVMPQPDEGGPILDDDLEEPETLNEAITGYDAQDEARICPHPIRAGKCFKGPRCKLEHVTFASDGITTDKALIFDKAFVEIVPPKTGDCVDIFITGCVNTCHFYAHVINDRSSSGPFNDNFQIMTNRMNDSHVGFKTLKIYPSLGEIVVVKHLGYWYRGRCIGPGQAPETVSIFLVDFGVTTAKHLSELREISEDFLQVPFQALEFMLDSITQKFEADHKEALDFFVNCMNFKSFKAYVVSGGQPLRVELVDSQDLSLSYVLNTWGLSQPRPNNMNTSDDCLLQLNS